MSPARRAAADGPLTVDLIVDRAIGLVARDGIDALSMRKLGAELGADPMAVYHHVSDKQTLLALMADSVVARIVPQRRDDWRSGLRATVFAARAVMLQHPWTARVISDTPQPGPATLAYLDAVFGILRGGLSISLTHHAIHLLGSRVLGFSEDLFDDRAADRIDDATRAAQADLWAETLPHVAELARAAEHEGGLGGCDDDEEFAFAIEVIIEGLARRA